MKKTHLFRTIIIALSFGLMILLCACGNTGTGAESSEASSKVELTAEQQVEKLLLEEFEKMYGDDMELCEFREVKIFTAEGSRRQGHCAASPRQRRGGRSVGQR